MEPIFLKPAFREKIWGGTKLRDIYDMTIPSDHTGEAWLISAHPNNPSTVTYPEVFNGTKFGDFYNEHPEYFGPHHLNPFPLLIKILDATQYLSVQVHPDDDYSLMHEGELGKTESWYVISADPGAQLIYGHHAQTKEEFEQRTKDGEWQSLLREVPVQEGDFFYVPHGTIHALGKGVMVLEVQQNSDTTYRVYDFDRIGDDGNKRELHLEKSADVTTIPFRVPQIKKETQQYAGGSVTRLLTEEHFSVLKWSVTEALSIETHDNYYCCAVIDGEGLLELGERAYPIKKGEAFIIPFGEQEATLSGNLTIIASCPEENKD